jgi:hypothetical protein
MILHCEICSQGGQRMNFHSQVARIREDLIRLPLAPEMFEAVSDRETVPPWAPGCDWIWMRCPWHHGPWWMATDDRTVQAIEQGGPSRLCTDEGWIEIDSRGIVKARAENVELDTPPPIPEKDLLDMINDLVSGGATHTQIAERLGVTRQKVTRILRNAGAYDG